MKFSRLGILHPVQARGGLLFLLAGLFFFPTSGLSAERTSFPEKAAGRELPSAKTPEQDWEEEFVMLEDHLQRRDKGWFNIPRLEKEAKRISAVYSDEDKRPADVVYRRTEALLDHLLASAPHRDERLFKAQSDLLSWVTQYKTAPPWDKRAEMESFKDLCRIRRELAFANPLLDFDKLVFLQRYSQRQGKGEIHMVDQFLGFNAKPGGSLCVLENPFSDKPQVRTIFENVPVSNSDGRSQNGKPLKDGAYLSLELSHDARTLYFAWTQAKSDIIEKDADWSRQAWSFDEVRRRPVGYHHYYWAPDRVYHIYRGDLETGELRQLTDGSDNTYDPCELPCGRVVYISESIGGNQRCGARWLASASLHSMKKDGSDAYPLSYHETNEWQPSVANDGLIAYTRWDYVDRDNSGAHHMWTCYPDGRNPRSQHSNYAIVNTQRPFMELGIRAIPGSSRFVATAASHHGTAYGSLILIDPNVPDDRMMSQVKRLTPEALFQEAEKAPGYPHPLEQAQINPQAEYYGTPWPLSEDFFLCVYARNQRDYGLYLVDSFGNRELIWQSPDVPCCDPIPLRARPVPRVIPDMTTQSVDNRPEGAPLAGMGEVVVLNVYNSEFPLPKGSKIKWLRVVNIFPKTNAYLNEPQVGYGNEALTRGSLGLVPVEDDGSVFFKMPTGINVYFQLLDEQKQAVHSMRSSTYLHSGERLSCIGCHEDKRLSPENSGQVRVKALNRPPSDLQPEPRGAFPVSFPRLVQPVLDRHCVSCHAEKNSKMPLDARTFSLVKKEDGSEERKENFGGWSNGFLYLKDRGWGKHGGVNSHIKANKTTYSIPGEVGAQASALLPFLKKGHKDVKLTSDDWHRLTLWLDLNTNYYGDYHETEKQSRGGLVMPRLGTPSEYPPGLPEKE